jgi:hypothetical protein
VGKLKVELGLEGTRFGFQFLSFENFKFRCFKKIRKNVDVENVVLYHCVNFHRKNTLYFRLSKNNKISQKRQKRVFSVLFITIHGQENLNLSFLLSLKYNIFRSKNLYTHRIQHSLYPCIFSKFFVMFKFEILELQNLASL